MEDLAVTEAFWSGRRVMVTGHTGFKGSWLCLWLQQLGARVAGFALAPPTTPSLFEAAAVGEGMQSIVGDVRDGGLLATSMRSFEPSVVFHLAAQALVRRSYEDPLETYSTNVMGTAHLLAAVRATTTVRAAVIVTSDKCYDLHVKSERHAETDPLGGDDPYSASKAAAEMIVYGYRGLLGRPEPSGLAVATARAGNVIGGGDWSQDRLVPDLIAAFRAGRPALIRQPGAIRPWQHVVDPLRGYLMLAQRLAGDDGADFAQAWNFGPASADEQPVAVLADRSTELWGGGATWARDTIAHPAEAATLRLDSTKAADRLGWRARIGLEAGLQRTIHWYRSWFDGADARALLNADIEALTVESVRS
ncbi:MAG: CDP-glucose 4,6-dehydratase [Candidatus Eremiobacteraeota bacterium]|nr:CDP-glucose 4,6-dehydratase [Candidatus Eremiobacteraeota bacterium]